MPSSRRHRLVKIREEIVRTQGKGRGGGGSAPLHATGITAPMRPVMPKDRGMGVI